jgi:hypothetical protein
MMKMSLQSVEKVGRQEKVHEERELFLFFHDPHPRSAVWYWQRFKQPF